MLGTVSPGYEAVAAAFASSQASDPGGAQLTVYHHGQKVIDVWTGKDTMKDRPYPEDGIGVLASCTKGLSATCAHLLLQRGQLDLAAPVATYWPEFAIAGKEKITIQHVLSHQGGLAALPASLDFHGKDLLDSAYMVRSVAEMEPLWEPGTAYFYHGLTFGSLVGELVRRITGKTIGQFFHDEIAAPLGLDLWIGLPADKEPRIVPQILSVAEATSAPTPEAQDGAMNTDLSSPLVQAVGLQMSRMDEVRVILDSPPGHAVEIPSGNGIGDARSLAKMYATIIGPVDGVGPILSSSTILRATTPQTDGLALPGVFAKMPDPFPLRFGLGYELSRAGDPMLGEGSFGHCGAGGRLGFAHPESGIAVGYTCSNAIWNHTMGPDARWMGWIGELEKIVKLV